MTLSGPDDHSQRFRYWHTTKTYGGMWSGAQLNYGTTNDDGDMHISLLSIS